MPLFNPRITTRQFLISLAIIVFLGLALRLWVGIELHDSPAVQAPARITDMATYRSMAQGILEGDLPEKFYYQPFYYTVFLPAVLFLSGGSAWGVIIAQAFLGGGAVWLTGLIGARCFGRPAGLTGALFLALAKMHIFYTPFALIAVLQSFWIILLLYLALQAYRNPSWLNWGLTGFVSGLGILTRGNVWFLVPVILAAGLWRLRHRPGRAVGVAALVLVLCYLPQLPFAIRNYRAAGRWTGPSTAAEAVLALGNTPEAPPGGLTWWEYPPTYEYWMRTAQAEGADRVSVAARILRWASREPGAYIELKTRMFILFWNRLEIPNNVSIHREGGNSYLLRTPVLLPFWFIGASGLAGLLYGIVRHRRDRARLMVYGFIVMYCGATVAFYILARFRLPVVPVLCVSGAGFVGDLVRLAVAGGRTRHRRRRILGMVVAGGFSVAFVAGGFQFYQGHVEKRIMRWVRPGGVATKLSDSIRLYDHGPEVLGGWESIPWPRQKVVLQKLFQIPGWLPEATYRIRSVRIPIVAPGAAAVTVKVALPGELITEKAAEIPARHRNPVWVTIRIPEDKRRAVDGPVAGIRVWLEGDETSGLGTIIDAQRDYGRTKILVSPARIIEPRGEFAAEIELE